jgi:polar amino acid transport system substrate-binding protein
MAAPDAVVAELAPSGKLRAAINFGNAVLARREAGGEPGGITVDLARELARRLRVPVEFVLYEQAGQVFKALDDNGWDVCFLAIEPARAARIGFTAPYILIEGAYLVVDASLLHGAREVDRAGTRVAVVAGSAYDLFLSRELEHASLVRVASAAEVIELLRVDRADVVAGVKPQLAADARRLPGLRLLPEPFMSIRQAMGTPRERAAAVAYLTDFVEEMKRSGFVSEAFARNRIEGASVAP